MDDIYLSPSAYHALKRDFGRNDLADAMGYMNAYAFGIPLRESRAFPHQFKCATCDGTGEGHESTYCKRCSGAGEIRAIGMMGTTIITEPLPKAFQPYFPANIVPLPPLSRGLR